VGILDHSKPTCAALQEQPNVSVFESDRKMSKETMVWKSSRSKVFTPRNKIEPNKNNFIAIQKNFMTKNTPKAHLSREGKTQRNLYTRSPDQNEFISPKNKNFHPRRMLSPKASIPRNL
jgi:hypothetical protein